MLKSRPLTFPWRYSTHNESDDHQAKNCLSEKLSIIHRLLCFTRKMKETRKQPEPELFNTVRVIFEHGDGINILESV